MDETVRRRGSSASLHDIQDDEDESKETSSISPARPSTALMRVVAAMLSLVSIYALWFLLSQPSEQSALEAEGTLPRVVQSRTERVWWSGWITAASTSLGVLPFLLPWTSKVHASTLATANAIAGGMMIAASLSLTLEGLVHDSHVHDAREGREITYDDDIAALLHAMHPSGRVLIGIAAGLAFIMFSKRWLESHEDVKFSGFEGVTARRVVLLLTVMTLHSLAEGIGIGVSFGSEHESFGNFISATLAIHNVPEGLAICLVTIPKGVPVIDAGVWAFFTSLPQPLMALPAYLFVQRFLPVLPVGLGFAAGAMSFVAVFELLAEAQQSISARRAWAVAASAGALMWLLQYLFAGH